MAERLPKQLPPDPEGQNDDRAEWADAAIAAFRAVTGTDLEDAVSDLIADLMHWCDRHDISFSEELYRGQYHYRCETTADE